MNKQNIPLPNTQSVRPKVSPSTLSTWLLTTLVLALALAALVGTDRWFTLLEDETEIVTASRMPVVQTARLFWNGQGQHEHPPLSDILLHSWLPVGGAAQWSLRLPSIIFYLIGLLILALAAREIGGPSAFTSLLAIGLLWPFGFHFGRMVGWYSFCFFLVAVVTWAYLRHMERPSGLSSATFVIAALFLVYSNYYGWVVISCFAIDVFISGRQKEGGKLLLITFRTLVIAYTPIWTVFVKEITDGADFGGGLPLTSRLLYAVYNLYSLFVSESVAPWFWYLSVPASICIVVSIFLAAALLSKDRRFFVYFALLFGGMAALGIIVTKRLLFISDWLLLAFAIALSNRERRTTRNLLMVTLACIAAIGWTGIVARKYYAAPHFVEPWAEIADQAAISLKDGAVIISNSPSFLFYLHYSLQRLDLVSRSSLPGWAEHPAVVSIIEQHNEVPHTNLSSVLFVKGVNTDLVDETEQVERWLHSHCASCSEQTLVADSGSALKARFFKEKTLQQPPLRISLQRFDCSRDR